MRTSFGRPRLSPHAEAPRHESDPTSDAELVRRIVEAKRSGSKKSTDHAWAELDRQVRPRLFVFVKRFFQSEEDTKDAVNRTMEKLYTNIEQWEPASSFLSWATQVARNTSIDQQRSNRRSKAALIPGRNEYNALEAIPGQANPEHDVSQQEFLANLDQSLLTTLNQGEQDVLYLFSGAELTVKEIAEHLGISAASVTKRLTIARQKLRALPKAA